MTAKQENPKKNEVEALSHSLSELVVALHGENFPVIANNLKTEKSGIDGIHTELGGRPSHIVVLHEWGKTPATSDYRLIITGGNMGDLRNLSIQSQNPEQVGGESVILTEGPSVSIDDYAAEKNLSPFRQWLKRLSGEVILQDFVDSIGRTVLTCNRDYSQNPLTDEKVSSIMAVVTQAKK